MEVYQGFWLVWQEKSIMRLRLSLLAFCSGAIFYDLLQTRDLEKEEIRVALIAYVRDELRPDPTASTRRDEYLSAIGISRILIVPFFNEVAR